MQEEAATTAPVLHEAKLPNGYRWNIAAGGAEPVFDRGGRTVWLRFHADGSVSWQLRGTNGEVLEPSSSGSRPEGGDSDA